MDATCEVVSQVVPLPKLERAAAGWANKGARRLRDPDGDQDDELVISWKRYEGVCKCQAFLACKLTAGQLKGMCSLPDVHR